MAENAEILQGISTSLNTVVEKLSEKKEHVAEPSLNKMIQLDQLVGAVKSIDKRVSDAHEKMFKKNKIDVITLQSAKDLGEIKDSLKILSKKATDTPTVATKQTPVENTTTASKQTDTPQPTKKASFWESASISSKISSVASKAKGAFSLAKPKDQGAKKLSPFGLTVKTLLSSIDLSLAKLTKLTEKSDADKFLAAEDRKKKNVGSIETKKDSADKKKDADKNSNAALIPMTMQKWVLGMIPSIITLASGAFLGYKAGMKGGATAMAARVGRTVLQAGRIKNLRNVKPAAKVLKAGFNKTTSTFVTKQAAAASKRVAPKMAARVAGKIGAKAGKYVPLLGIGIGAGLTIARLKQMKDSDSKMETMARGAQAFGEAASTAAAQIPVVGTAASMMIDAGNIWTDNIINSAKKNVVTQSKADKAQIQYSQNLEKLSDQLAARVANGEISQAEADKTNAQIKHRDTKERKTKLLQDLGAAKDAAKTAKNRGFFGRGWNEVKHLGGAWGDEEYFDEKAAANASTGRKTYSDNAFSKRKKDRQLTIEANPDLEKNKNARVAQETLDKEQQIKNDVLMNEQIAAARESTAQGKLMVKILQDTYKKPPVVLQHQLGPDLYPNAGMKA